jgi:arginase family enzyme
MRRVLDHLPPDRLLQIGVRSCSKEEAEYALESGIRAFTSEDVIEKPQEILSAAGSRFGNSGVYLTIDLDILDPAFAPGVAAPEPGGPSTIEILRLVRGLGKLNIRGFDVVEFVPPHDNGTTAFTAAKIIYELLAAIAGSRKREQR